MERIPIWKITIFLVVVFALKYGQDHYRFLSEQGISSIAVILFLAVLFLLLLSVETISIIRHATPIALAKRRTFFLGFVVGGVLGVIGAYTGHGGDATFPVILINIIVAGTILGALASWVSGVVVRIAPRKDISGIDNRAKG